MTVNPLLLVLVLFMLYVPLVAQEEVESPQEIRIERAIQGLGDILQIALPIGAGLTTVFVKDNEGFWQFTKAYATTLLVTYSLKYVINKPRPDGATDGHSFPSGHTSSAFSGASFIQKRYGWSYGIPAYTFASFVAFSRVEGLHDRHDIWDVVGGAIIGIGSNYIFTTPYQKEQYELRFSAKEGAYALGIVITF